MSEPVTFTYKETCRCGAEVEVRKYKQLLAWRQVHSIHVERVSNDAEPRVTGGFSDVGFRPQTDFAENHLEFS